MSAVEWLAIYFECELMSDICGNRSVWEIGTTAPKKNSSSSLRDDVYNCKSSAAVGRCCWMISMAQTRLLLVVSNRKENIFFFSSSSSPSIYTRENRSLSQPAAARSMLQSIGAAPQPFLHCPCYWGLPNFLPFSDNIICGEFFRALAVWLFWAAGWFPAARRPCIIIIIQLTAVLHHRHWR